MQSLLLSFLQISMMKDERCHLTGADTGFRKGKGPGNLKY